MFKRVRVKKALVTITMNDSGKHFQRVYIDLDKAELTWNISVPLTDTNKSTLAMWAHLHTHQYPQVCAAVKPSSVR